MPIGKGARFLVLAGDLRGREGVVTECNHGELLDWYRLDLSADTFVDATLVELEGLGFKRLHDAPDEVDPLFAELAMLEAARAAVRDDVRIDDDMPPESWCFYIEEDVEHARDAIGAEIADADGVYRAAMMRAAVRALAAVRCIDRCRAPG